MSRNLFQNRFSVAINRLRRNHDRDMYLNMINNDAYSKQDLIYINDQLGQDIDRVLQRFVPPIRIHDEWSRETMSKQEIALVDIIISHLPNMRLDFYIYSYGDIPYSEPISLLDYGKGKRSYTDYFDAVVEGIKLIKTDYRGYARNAGIALRHITRILLDIVFALVEANDDGDLEDVDPIETYDYENTSMIGPSH